MRQPTHEDLSGLHNRSADWFASWLFCGLHEYLFDGLARKAFPGAENFVDQPEGNIAADLALIAEALQVREREAFKADISIALRERDFSREKDVILATFLIELGGSLSATGMLSVVVDKAYTIPRSAEGQRLFDVCFSIVDQLADIEPVEAVTLMRHLVAHSRLFEPAFAARALVAMTKAEPRKFPLHFAFLKSHLDDELGIDSRSDFQEAARARRRRVLLKTLIALIPDGAGLAEPCRPDGLPRPEERNWWLLTLAAEFPELLDKIAAALPTEEERKQISISAPFESEQSVGPKTPEAQLAEAIEGLGDMEKISDKELELAW
jgi:hypothetical protein